MSLRLTGRRLFALRATGQTQSALAIGLVQLERQRITAKQFRLSMPALGAHAAVGPRMRQYTTGRGSQTQGAKDSAPPATSDLSAVVIRADPTLPGQSLTLIQKIKGFIAFYKGGLKELVANIRAAADIRRRIAGGQRVTRSELQVDARTAQDKWRLAPFGFLVVVIPELIPLTIYLFPGVCPSTCVTYAQLAKMSKKRDAARQLLHVRALPRLGELGLAAAAFANTQELARLALEPRLAEVFDPAAIQSADLGLICRFLGLGSAGLLTSEQQLRARLVAYLDYLRADDRLLVEEQLVERVGLVELLRACQERAIPLAARSEAQLRDELRRWTNLTQTHALPMLPIVWSRLALLDKPVAI
ncbi:hypothetical protein GGI04_000613 [Coemansia thaxteri]|nr:hypothetical protein GGI04_000613 [Coemansia thaxteri]KAJ2474179.1 hypothetical protein GGI02_000306 [Coemansia sp. RSA 2322]